MMQYPNSLLSFGGGVNSVAMTIMLAAEGWRGPVVFADTGTEWPATYCYIDYFRPWMEDRGLEFIVLGPDYRALVPGRDERSLVEYCEDYAVTPFPAARWCTQGWKTDPIHQWAREQGIERQLVGIAADEAHRRRDLEYPLLGRGITRQGCVEIIQGVGLDVPQKSGCYICPFQRIGQWRELWRLHPDLFERAANLERLSSARRGVQAHIRVGGEHTLDELRAGFESQVPMFDDDELDGLLAYRACVCAG